MAAGLGFKDFTTGEVLTAADVDGYLMQGIWVFASTAARDAAVTAPAEGNFAFTKDTNSLWYYDGAAWVASGATGDIEGVTAGVGISGGGTSGTVTITNSMATAIDAKGDLVPGTGADTFAKLSVGANNTVLTADSAEATGMKWAAAGGSLTLSSIASGSMPSATQLNLTGLTQDYFVLRLEAVTWGTGGDVLKIRFNSNSGGVYSFSAYNVNATNFQRDYGSSATEFPINLANARNNSGNNSYTIVIQNAKAAGFHDINIMGQFLEDSSGSSMGLLTGGVFKNATQITSIQIFTSSSYTFTGGTYQLIGG